MDSYKNHEKENGLFLCSEVENVKIKRIGRYVYKDEKFIMEAREIALEHYTKMFLEHQRGINYANNRIRKIIEEI
jgi:hypothetical protein